MKLHTKSDFTALMHRFLDPLLPLYSEGGARLHLGDTGVTYPGRTIEMEAFSRPLWALAPFWTGGGRADDFLRIYRKGLASGTDPESPEYWGDPNDYDQLFVEMAALACAILETPESVWEPLTDAEKANLAKWLDTINHHDLPGCNWLLFRVLVNLALDSVGMPCDMARAAADMAEVDKWYVADGWYSDGPADIKPQKDYYNPWAIQYYTVLYSVFAAKSDPARAALYRDRVTKFGQQFARWFDENGAALPFGRSLTYRIGQSAFYSACIWAGLEPLPLPVMKGIIVRNLNWWLARPIFDRDGVLTIGYGYPQQYMAEQYNAPGSPYWGLKVFFAAGPARRPPVLDRRGRPAARRADPRRCDRPAQRRPAFAASAGRPAERLLARQLREGRPRPVCREVRQVRLQHAVRLLGQPQLCAAGAGRARQYAGLRHRRLDLRAPPQRQVCPDGRPSAERVAALPGHQGHDGAGAH